MHKEDSKLALWWHLNKNTIKCYQETMLLKFSSIISFTSGKIAGRIPFRGNVLVREWSTTTLVMQKGG